MYQFLSDMQPHTLLINSYLFILCTHIHIPIINMISVLSCDVSINLSYLCGPLTSQLQHLLILACLFLFQILDPQKESPYLSTKSIGNSFVYPTPQLFLGRGTVPLLCHLLPFLQSLHLYVVQFDLVRIRLLW